MLRGEDEVLHAGIPGQRHPFPGVKSDGIELFIEIVVHVRWDLATSTRSTPLAVARPADLGSFEADRAPMNEETETSLPPPLHILLAGVQIRFFAFGGAGRRQAMQTAVRMMWNPIRCSSEAEPQTCMI